MHKSQRSLPSLVCWCCDKVQGMSEGEILLYLRLFNVWLSCPDTFWFFICLCFAVCGLGMQVILSGKWKMGVRVAYLTLFILLVLGLMFYCEFLIYYFVLLQVSDAHYWHAEQWSWTTNNFSIYKSLVQESVFILVVYLKICKWLSQNFKLQSRTV